VPNIPQSNSYVVRLSLTGIELVARADKRDSIFHKSNTCRLVDNNAYVNDRWQLYSVVLMGKKSNCVEFKLVIRY